MGQHFRPCGERVVFTDISKDKSGKQVTFKTVVDALNFMSQRGWVLETEFSENYIDEGSSYGGIITATAGEYAAGIGGGKNCNCGDITITGGTVTAYGGTKSAGIGSSMGSDCGNIRITDGVTKVTVYSGSAYAIGPGYNGSCGTVNIGGKSGGVAGAPYIYQP